MYKYVYKVIAHKQESAGDIAIGKYLCYDDKKQLMGVCGEDFKIALCFKGKMSLEEYKEQVELNEKYFYELKKEAIA